MSYRSLSFDGPGWYLFGDRLFWAEASASEFLVDFIDLSDQQGSAVVANLAPRFFDATCTHKWMPVEQPWQGETA